MRGKRLGVLMILALGLFACVANDPYQRTKVGAGSGAVLGGVLGQVFGGDTESTVIGAASGAVLGGAVGAYMDKQQRDFEQALAAEQQQNELQIQRLRDDTLKLSVNNEISFDFGKADVKPAFYSTLDKLGGVIQKYDRTVVHIVGHTDNIGSDSSNLTLSQRRASSVGSYLTSRGVPASRLRTEGRGEREPRDNNDTDAGRQLNRRVEIYVKPIVEGQEQQAYEPPPRNI